MEGVGGGKEGDYFRTKLPEILRLLNLWPCSLVDAIQDFLPFPYFHRMFLALDASRLSCI